MLWILIIFIVTAFYVWHVRKTESVPQDNKTAAVVRTLSRVLRLVPPAVVLILLVLFLTVLSGQLPVRMAHGLTVLGLWMIAMAFYLDMLRWFSQLRLRLTALAGMLASVAAAVYMTPLNRFADTVYHEVHQISFCLGLGLLAVYYISDLLRAAARKEQEKE